MKQIVFSLVFLCAMYTYAQEEVVTAEEQEQREWFHSNFSETGIRGVGDQAARDFLNSKGLKPQTITVAVLDSGVEIDHEDLKNNIWVNPGEIAGNGIDDDKNGYIDDVNGWDFIGGKDGKDVGDDTLEMTRIVKQFQPVFESEDESTNAANITKMPETYQMYLDAKKDWEETSANNIPQFEKYTAFLNDLKQASAGTAEDAVLTEEIVGKLNEPELKTALNEALLSGNPIPVQAIITSIQGGVDHFASYAEYMLNLDFDPRPIVGDNYDDPFEQYYGNNEVEGPGANHGTHVSGIIAAERNNGLGMDGIAGDVAKIMVVRTVPDGDERDKDVANSIRYAADNGAKIMNMSFGKDFSPYKEVVWQAILYADRKGVLMFHAAGNDNKDVDVLPNFPTNFRDGKSFTKNWVTVGASTRDNDELRANFSNYGKEKVDLFSPGAEIYSTVTDNTYDSYQGTSMASPAAAGCAALLWSYFPKLNATQVRDLLMQSVNTFDGVQVVGENEENVPFNDLSVSGGVIDVYKAAQLAYEKYGSKKSVKK